MNLEIILSETCKSSVTNISCFCKGQNLSAGGALKVVNVPEYLRGWPYLLPISTKVKNPLLSFSVNNDSNIYIVSAPLSVNDKTLFSSWISTCGDFDNTGDDVTVNVLNSENSTELLPFSVWRLSERLPQGEQFTLNCFSKIDSAHAETKSEKSSDSTDGIAYETLFSQIRKVTANNYSKTNIYSEANISKALIAIIVVSHGTTIVDELCEYQICRGILRNWVIPKPYTRYNTSQCFAEVNDYTIPRWSMLGKPSVQVIDPGYIQTNIAPEKWKFCNEWLHSDWEYTRNIKHFESERGDFTSNSRKDNIRRRLWIRSRVSMTANDSIVHIQNQNISGIVTKDIIVNNQIHKTNDESKRIKKDSTDESVESKSINTIGDSLIFIGIENVELRKISKHVVNSENSENGESKNLGGLGVVSALISNARSNADKSRCYRAPWIRCRLIESNEDAVEDTESINNRTPTSNNNTVDTKRARCPPFPILSQKKQATKVNLLWKTGIPRIQLYCNADILDSGFDIEIELMDSINETGHEQIDIVLARAKLSFLWLQDELVAYPGRICKCSVYLPLSKEAGGKGGFGTISKKCDISDLDLNNINNGKIIGNVSLCIGWTSVSTLSASIGEKYQSNIVLRSGPSSILHFFNPIQKPKENFIPNKNIEFDICFHNIFHWWKPGFQCRLCGVICHEDCRVEAEHTMPCWSRNVLETLKKMTHSAGKKKSLEDEDASLKSDDDDDDDNQDIEKIAINDALLDNKDALGGREIIVNVLSARLFCDEIDIDSFVSVSVANVEQRTQIVFNDVNPVFSREFKFSKCVVTPHESISIQVQDYTNATTLGTLLLSADDIIQRDAKIYMQQPRKDFDLNGTATPVEVYYLFGEKNQIVGEITLQISHSESLHALLRNVDPALFGWHRKQDFSLGKMKDNSKRFYELLKGINKMLKAYDDITAWKDPLTSAIWLTILLSVIIYFDPRYVLGWIPLCVVIYMKFTYNFRRNGCLEKRYGKKRKEHGRSGIHFRLAIIQTRGIKVVDSSVDDDYEFSSSIESDVSSSQSEESTNNTTKQSNENALLETAMSTSVDTNTSGTSVRSRLKHRADKVTSFARSALLHVQEVYSDTNFTSSNPLKVMRRASCYSKLSFTENTSNANRTAREFGQDLLAEGLQLRDTPYPPGDNKCGTHAKKLLRACCTGTDIRKCMLRLGEGYSSVDDEKTEDSTKLLKVLLFLIDSGVLKQLEGPAKSFSEEALYTFTLPPADISNPNNKGGVLGGGTPTNIYVSVRYCMGAISDILPPPENFNMLKRCWFFLNQWFNSQTELRIFDRDGNVKVYNRLVGNTNTVYDSANPLFGLKMTNCEEKSFSLLTLKGLCQKREREHHATSDVELIRWPLDKRDGVQYSHLGGTLLQSYSDTFEWVELKPEIFYAGQHLRKTKTVKQDGKTKTEKQYEEDFVLNCVAENDRIYKTCLTESIKNRDIAQKVFGFDSQYIPWREAAANVVLDVWNKNIYSLFDSHIGKVIIPIIDLFDNPDEADTEDGLQQMIFKWFPIKDSTGNSNGEALVRIQISAKNHIVGDNVDFDKKGFMEKYHNGLGSFCSVFERFINLMNWTHPQNSLIFLCILMACSLIFLFIPLKVVFTCVVLHQFTHLMRHNGGVGWMLASLVSSVPDHVQLDAVFSHQKATSVMKTSSEGNIDAEALQHKYQNLYDVIPSCVCSGYIRCADASGSENEWRTSAPWQRLFVTLEPAGRIRIWKSRETCCKYIQCGSTMADKINSPLKIINLPRSKIIDNPIAESQLGFLITANKMARIGVIMACESRPQFRMWIDRVRAVKARAVTQELERRKKRSSIGKKKKEIERVSRQKDIYKEKNQKEAHDVLKKVLGGI